MVIDHRSIDAFFAPDTVHQFIPLQRKAGIHTVGGGEDIPVSRHTFPQRPTDVRLTFLPGARLQQPAVDIADEAYLSPTNFFTSARETPPWNPCCVAHPARSPPVYPVWHDVAVRVLNGVKSHSTIPGDDLLRCCLKILWIWILCLFPLPFRTWVRVQAREASQRAPYQCAVRPGSRP